MTNEKLPKTDLVSINMDNEPGPNTVNIS